MSSKPAPKDAEPTAAAAAETPKPPAQTASASETEQATQATPIPGRLSPGVYAFTAPHETLYLDVPLTARPADGDRPATVFDWWQTGPPDDGRWEPTRKKPNQAPDNAAAPSSEE